MNYMYMYMWKVSSYATHYTPRFLDSLLLSYGNCQNQGLRMIMKLPPFQLNPTYSFYQLFGNTLIWLLINLLLLNKHTMYTHYPARITSYNSHSPRPVCSSQIMQQNLACILLTCPKYCCPKLDCYYTALTDTQKDHSEYATHQHCYQNGIDPWAHRISLLLKLNVDCLRLQIAKPL